jgi:hypothetical protein
MVHDLRDYLVQFYDPVVSPAGSVAGRIFQ